MLHLLTLLPLLLAKPSHQAPQLPLLLPFSGRADILVDATNMDAESEELLKQYLKLCYSSGYGSGYGASYGNGYGNGYNSGYGYAAPYSGYQSYAPSYGYGASAAYTL